MPLEVSKIWGAMFFFFLQIACLMDFFLVPKILLNCILFFILFLEGKGLKMENDNEN